MILGHINLRELMLQRDWSPFRMLVRKEDFARIARVPLHIDDKRLIVGLSYKVASTTSPKAEKDRVGAIPFVSFTINSFIAEYDGKKDEMVVNVSFKLKDKVNYDFGK